MAKVASVDQKRVLIVSYTYPPENAVSAMRPLRVGRAFERANWQVMILKSSYTGFSGGLDVELPKWSLFEYEPGRLSRWLAFNGQAGTYSNALRSVARRFILPEHTWLLKDTVKRQMERIIEATQPDCVVTISYPFVLHVALQELHRGAAPFVWVADNRDMWAGHGGKRWHLAPTMLLESIERSVFRDCDVASFAAPSTLRAYRARYEHDGMNCSVCVLNGAEEGAASRGPNLDERPRDDLRFVHSGSLYSGRRDLSPLLRCLEIVRPTTQKRIKLVLVGQDSVAAKDKIKHFDGVEIVAAGQVSRSASLELQRGADFLVVAMENSSFDRTFVPAKILEYAMHRIPVVAVADEASDLAMIIDKYGLGICSRDESALASFIIKVRDGGWQRPSELHELTAEHQFGLLVAEVERLLASERGA